MTQIEFYKLKLSHEIDASDLYNLIQNKENILVVDARSEEHYTQEHIPSAINIPHRLMNPKSVSHLDKSALLVCYCDGIGCNASTKGSLNLAKLGFKVKELLGGIEWWKFDGYGTEGLKATKESTVPKCSC
ncbi:rhodanese-like domain-containing protein [Spirochaeta cellobiosiphila]|uniref:rhodanese-like domain-containing protein n=1 Tax=Spirochaeta cellobiosiphila TaxID=504483 RepID=UPI00040D2D71|nr:rhodanese-like domain-containing protein [Spirochaeta cellobiosiphila]